MKGAALAVGIVVALAVPASAGATLHAESHKLGANYIDGPGTSMTVWADECFSTCPGRVEVSRVVGEECTGDDECVKTTAIVYRDNIFEVGNSPATPESTTYPWSCSRTGTHYWKAIVDTYDASDNRVPLGVTGGSFTVPACHGKRAYAASRLSARRVGAEWGERGNRTYRSTNCGRRATASRWVCRVRYVRYTPYYEPCVQKLVVRFYSRLTLGKRTVSHTSRRSGKPACIPYTGPR